MSKTNHVDSVYKATGGVARMLNDIIGRVRNGVGVKDAIEWIARDFAKEFKRSLDVVYSSQPKQEEKNRMVSMAISLMSDFSADMATPGYFHDSGMTVYNPALGTCRIINKPAEEALMDFLTSPITKWKPIDLSVCKHLHVFCYCSCFVFSLLLRVVWYVSCVQNPNSRFEFEEQCLNAIYMRNIDVDFFEDEELGLRMGPKFNLLITRPRKHSSDRSIVLWLKENSTCPLIDAILYKTVDGKPTDVVFLQLSVMTPKRHASGKAPSKAVIHGKWVSV